MKKTLVFGLAAAAFLLGMGAPTEAAIPKPAQCHPEVMQRLDALGVEKDRLSKIWYGVNREVGMRPKALGYTAWVNLDDGRGNLVITMRKTCAVKTEYCTGDCDIEGVKTF